MRTMKPTTGWRDLPVLEHVGLDRCYLAAHAAEPDQRSARPTIR
jgi:hypothetical protein